MRTIYLVIFISVFTSCSVDNEKKTSNEKPKTTVTTPNTPQCNQLLFSIKNVGENSLKDIEIHLPDTTIFYSTLKAQTQSEWVCVKSAYSYAFLKYKDEKDSSFVQQIKDFVGETLYEKGKMTYVVNYDPKDKKFEWTYTIQNLRGNN